MRAWVAAFLFCQIIEIPIYARGLSTSVPAAFGASAITHPLMWFCIVSPHWQASYLTKAIAGELFAWLVEAAYFRFLFRKRRALLWSLVANVTSLGAGLLSHRLFGMP